MSAHHRQFWVVFYAENTRHTVTSEPITHRRLVEMKEKNEGNKIWLPKEILECFFFFHSCAAENIMFSVHELWHCRFQWKICYSFFQICFSRWHPKRPDSIESDFEFRSFQCTNSQRMWKIKLGITRNISNRNYGQSPLENVVDLTLIA